ncbi:MAG: hypothetical protein JEZ03_08860 [Bacteroidales bacterium]|nr:hypothetical protein [Bacteroidales bacterium]
MRLVIRLHKKSRFNSDKRLSHDFPEQIEAILKRVIHNYIVSKTSNSETRKIRSTFCYYSTFNQDVLLDNKSYFEITLSLLPGYYKKELLTDILYEQIFIMGLQGDEYDVVNIKILEKVSLKRGMIYKCISPIYLPIYNLENQSVNHKHVEPFQKEYINKFIQTIVNKRFLMNKEDFEIEEWEEPVFELLSEVKQVRLKEKYFPENAIAYDFTFKAILPVELHSIAYYSGFGEQTHLGCGMVEVVDEV